MWDLGATANAAFRRELLHESQIGRMDEALGPGTPAGGGEDIDLMFRFLKSGWTHVYFPVAWVSHEHRRTRSGFCRTLFQYSSGHSSYLLTNLFSYRNLRVIYRLMVEIPIWNTRRLLGMRHSSFPRKYVLAEIFGLAVSPLCLMVSRLRVLLIRNDRK